MIDAINAAIYSAIDAATTVPTHSHVPQNNGETVTPLPYVQLDEMELQQNDTDTELGFSGFFYVRVWSKHRGSKEAADIQKQIYDALHYSKPVVTGWRVITIHQEFATIHTDNDGITRMGVQRFRIIFEPEPIPAP